jgi:hypothetical protein
MVLTEKVRVLLLLKKLSDFMELEMSSIWLHNPELTEHISRLQTLLLLNFNTVSVFTPTST